MPSLSTALFFFNNIEFWTMWQGKNVTEKIYADKCQVARPKKQAKNKPKWLVSEVTGHPSVKKLNYFLSGHQQLNWRWERHPIIYNWRVSRGRMDIQTMELAPKVAMLWDSCQHFPTEYSGRTILFNNLILKFEVWSLKLVEWLKPKSKYTSNYWIE